MPNKAGPNDYMIINTTLLDKATIFATVASTYLENSVNKSYLINTTTNSSIRIDFPFQMFVTVFPNSTFKGNFQLKYQFFDLIGPDIGFPSDNSGSSDSISMISIILMSVFIPVGAALLGVLIYLIVFFHKKNVKLKRIKKLKNTEDN